MLNPISIATRGYISPAGGSGPTTIQFYDNIEVLLMADLEVQLASEEYTVTLESEFKVILDENDFDVEVC